MGVWPREGMESTRVRLLMRVSQKGRQGVMLTSTPHVIIHAYVSLWETAMRNLRSSLERGVDLASISKSCEAPCPTVARCLTRERFVLPNATLPRPLWQEARVVEGVWDDVHQLLRGSRIWSWPASDSTIFHKKPLSSKECPGPDLTVRSKRLSITPEMSNANLCLHNTHTHPTPPNYKDTHTHTASQHHVNQTRQIWQLPA